jgi:uncharacterized membrane protein
MRKPSLNLSPRQTIALSIFGALIAAAGLDLPIPHRNVREIPLWLGITLFSLIITGFAISFYANSDLESGLLNERWPEDEITSTRAFLSSPVFTAVTVLCLLVSFILMLVARSTRPGGWALLILGQSLQRLQTAARPPRPNRPTSTFTPSWQNFSPIHSDHWGER